MSDSVHCDISHFVRSECVVCGELLPDSSGAGRPRTTCPGEGDKLSSCRTHLNNARRRVETFKRSVTSSLSDAYVSLSSPGPHDEAGVSEVLADLADLFRRWIATSPTDITDMEAVRASWSNSNSPRGRGDPGK